MSITARKTTKGLTIPRTPLRLLNGEGFSYKSDGQPSNFTHKTTKINNRRYLGNKYKLLSFIKEVVESQCQGIGTVADIFAGTGAVASAFSDKKLITNDIMYSNYICQLAWFGPGDFSKEKVARIIGEYNEYSKCEENYVTKNFADTYFSRADCSKIGYIREDIEQKKAAGQINEKERALLITSLLYAMDKIANTCGHYDAYRQNVEFERHLELAVPLPEENLNKNNVCYNQDANCLVKSVEADLVYIDPPYNSRQYCDAYHLLENIAKWEKPEVFGVARKMDRTALKSDYCTKNAAKAFEDLIKDTKAKYILLSYNNMAEKGNDRSNAKIIDEDIFRILSQKGRVQVFSENYKAFTTGKSEIRENQERLFLCECHGKPEPIQSPLNYTGGKYKLLPQILPMFPRDMECFVDLFCGGGNVGLNVGCSRVQFSDNNEHLIGLFNTFKSREKEDVFHTIFDLIKEYQLSRSDEKGYQHYACNSSDGLGSYNKKPYSALRQAFNRRTEKDGTYYIMLYLLIVYSFNNQIRFNKKGEFNLPVGKRDFNKRMQNKLSVLINRIKSRDYLFLNQDFRKILETELSPGTFVYADPPYLITCATYNEGNGWGEQEERDLLSLLDQLDRRGIRFALSNVIESKGKKNQILEKWIKDNGHRYKMIDLNMSYSNASYHRKDRKEPTREVLIVNYREDGHGGTYPI